VGGLRRASSEPDRRGALPYAITCLGGQAIALVAVPVGLLAGFALYRAI